MTVGHSARTDEAAFLRRALVPFKAYIAGALLLLLLADVSGGDDAWVSSALVVIVYGYLGCTAILAVGAVVAAIRMRDTRTMWSALAYAGAGLILAAMLWPGAFPTPTKLQ
jgi:hypothetical protein